MKKRIIIRDEACRIGLTIKGYEFDAGEVEDDFDRNWLNIGVSYSDGVRRSRCTDPCLLTWERDSIISHLQGLLDGEIRAFDDDGDLWLTEPNLRLGARANEDGTFSVRVGFNPEHKMGGMGFFHAEQVFTRRELVRMVAMLRLSRKSFPKR